MSVGVNMVTARK